MANENLLFEGDLALFNNLIAGDINVENGQPTMEQGLETAIFISLYSGDKKSYWANENLQQTPTYQMGGEYEKLSEGLALNPQSAQRLNEAIKRDIQWLIDENIVNEITTQSSIINGAYQVVITVLKNDNSTQQFKYSNNWVGQYLSPSHEKS
jgi:phage gp46-like protein